MDGKKCVDPGLQTLLDMDGEIFLFEQSGHWVKIEAHPIEPNDQIPHGIKYSLTLHDKSNQRVLGFDNAHGFRPKRKKFGAQKVTWDHKHVKRSIEGYEFESAGQLMEDFWKAIAEIVKW